ncbi:MAG: TlpA family protein disulfide reductase [Balneolales bacterium]|nr:TlpA family protein disulfide reductase [Balneolales bacterium]
MNNGIKILVVLTVVALIAVSFLDFRSSSKSSGSGDYIDIIETASFTALDSDERIAVSDFEGKIVLVDFWETWCVPCLNSMPTFQQIMEEYPDQFVVLAVSPGWSDEPEDIISFKEKHDYDFVFVYDDSDVANNLEISGIPYKVFIGADGKYLSTEMGTGGHQRDYNKIVEMIQEHFAVAQR